MNRAALLLAAAALSGCNLAPTYRPPAPPVAAAFPEAATPPQGRPVAELGWREFFPDERLQSLVAAALANNRDLAQSMARIDQARAQYRIQASQRLPNVGVDGNGSRSQTPLSVAGVTAEAAGGSFVKTEQYAANVGVSAFELDLWGRVRNLSEAARARYLASVEGAQAFRLSLIAQVAATYFDIRAGEDRIQLAEQTVAGRREGLQLAQKRLDAGVTSTVDFDQSVLLLTQAETELAELERTTQQARHLLDVLVGGPVAAPLPDGRPLSAEQQVRPLAPGLPSALLEDRPDVREAEFNLRAANADIGAARAQFFPTISLTAGAGFASTQLADLFKGDSRSWSYGGGLSLPIFDWGSRQAQLKVDKARANELAAAYQRTIQGAFREVADALVARRTLAEQIDAQTRTVTAQRRLSRTAKLRYDNGIAIYLEVLDAERNLFAAEQQLLQLRAADLQNEVSLYVALGGGQLEQRAGPAAS